MKRKANLLPHRTFRVSRILARSAGRIALAEMLGDTVASTLVVMFPSMRWRRVAALWLSLLVFRGVRRRPGNPKLTAKSAV